MMITRDLILKCDVTFYIYSDACLRVGKWMLLCLGAGNLLCFEFSGFCVFLGNLNPAKDFDEIKAAVTKFFSKEGLEIQEVRLGRNK